MGGRGDAMIRGLGDPWWARRVAAVAPAVRARRAWSSDELLRAIGEALRRAGLSSGPMVARHVLAAAEGSLVQWDGTSWRPRAR